MLGTALPVGDELGDFDGSGLDVRPCEGTELGCGLMLGLVEGAEEGSKLRLGSSVCFVGI
jgi:hypothetical protein